MTTLQGSFRTLQHGNGGGGGGGGGGGFLSASNGHNHNTSVHSLAAVPDVTGSNWSLAMSPPPTEEARHTMVRPKNIVERARLNVA